MFRATALPHACHPGMCFTVPDASLKPTGWDHTTDPPKEHHDVTLVGTVRKASPGQLASVPEDCSVTRAEHSSRWGLPPRWSRLGDHGYNSITRGRQAWQSACETDLMDSSC